jgi:hypothetical protein
MGVVFLDVETPQDHLWEVRLGGVRQEAALHLEAEAVGELSLSPPRNDSLAYPRLGAVRAVEDVTHLLLTGRKCSQVALDTLFCAAPSVGDKNTGISILGQPVFILRVFEHPPAQAAGEGVERVFKAACQPPPGEPPPRALVPSNIAHPSFLGVGVDHLRPTMERPVKMYCYISPFKMYWYTLVQPSQLWLTDTAKPPIM